MNNNSPFPDPSKLITEYDYDGPFINHNVGKGPKGYKRSDESIYEDVCEALYMNPFVDASEIEVSITEGCVYLRGEIENRRMKKDAERVVERVRGVVDVQNMLHVKSIEDFLSRLTGDVHDYRKGLIRNRTGMI